MTSYKVMREQLQPGPQGTREWEHGSEWSQPEALSKGPPWGTPRASWLLQLWAGDSSSPRKSFNAEVQVGDRSPGARHGPSGS